MSKLYPLLNHSLSDLQKKDAQKHLSVYDFVEIPASIKETWKNISPKSNVDLSIFLKATVSYFEQEYQKCSQDKYVLVQGEFGATYYMVNQLFKIGFIPIYSTTERIVKEHISSSGQIETRRIFQHVCFRKYVR